MKIKTLVLTVSVVVFSCGIASAQATNTPALEPVDHVQAIHPAALSLPGIVIDEVMTPKIEPAPEVPQALLESTPARQPAPQRSSHS